MINKKSNRMSSNRYMNHMDYVLGGGSSWMRKWNIYKGIISKEGQQRFQFCSFESLAIFSIFFSNFF
jgi:hypothetical protein